MNDLIQLTGTVEIAAAKADGKRPEFSIHAYTGTDICLSGYSLPLVLDLATMKAAAQSIPVLREHDQERPVGHTTAVTIDKHGVNAVGVLSSDGPHAAEIIAMSRNGYPWQASVGAAAGRNERIKDGESVVVNGRTFKGPVLVMRNTVLREISFVSLGADADASAIVAARRGKTMNEFDTWITSQGFDPANLTDAQKALLKASWPGAGGDNTDVALVEMRRASDIEAVYRQYRQRNEDAYRDGPGSDTGAQVQARLEAARIKAQAEGWDKRRTELEMLRAERPVVGVLPPLGGGRGGSQDDHLVAALMVRAGYEKAAGREFGDHVMARSKPFQRATLVDIVRAALHARGIDTGHDRSQLIRAGISTAAIPTIISNVANKIALATWNEIAPTWRAFAAIKSTPDFKEASGIRPTFGGELELLPPAGEIQHGTIGEEVYNWTLNTYAKMYGIDRTTIINDDARVLEEVIPGFVKAAARMLSNLVWATILEGIGTHFATANSNTQTGAGSVLAAAGLAVAVKQMRLQEDPDGNVVGIEPRTLVVGPTLEPVARALLNSTELSRIATSDNAPTGNPYNSLNLQLAVEPRLEAGVTNPKTGTVTAGNATRWFLFGSPADVPVAIGFLDGRESPVVETFGFDSDPNTLAMKFRVYHDVGAALADPRAAQHSAGA